MVHATTLTLQWLLVNFSFLLGSSYHDVFSHGCSLKGTQIIWVTESRLHVWTKVTTGNIILTIIRMAKLLGI